VAKPTKDRRLGADIVAALQKGGPFKDPWARLPDHSARPNTTHLGRPNTPDEHPYAGMAPADFVAIEVQRSIDRVRLRNKPPSWVPKITATAADYRRLGRLLRKMGMGYERWDVQEEPRLAEQLGASDDVVQEPPARARDPLMHYCAAEAFDLMELFSATPPTFYEDGSYQIITQKLYEAVTGKADATVERVCDWVLTARRRYREHDRPPPLPDA
jgi:hypothetical protein